ncbi:MAG: hypothetical protein H6739_15005 [Alphaproteobacteria bacterium]|nr:hypothetical protein [Alphaproteobacteria bacterium]
MLTLSLLLTGCSQEPGVWLDEDVWSAFDPVQVCAQDRWGEETCGLEPVVRDPRGAPVLVKPLTLDGETYAWHAPDGWPEGELVIEADADLIFETIPFTAPLRGAEAPFDASALDGARFLLIEPPWFEPDGARVIFQEAGRLSLEFLEVTGSEARFRVLSEKEGRTCEVLTATGDIGEGGALSWSTPLFELPTQPGPTALRDVSLTLHFTPDLQRAAGLSVAGEVDLRHAKAVHQALSEALWRREGRAEGLDPPPEDALCAGLPMWGVTCLPCPDGEAACVHAAGHAGVLEPVPNDAPGAALPVCEPVLEEVMAPWACSGVPGPRSCGSTRAPAGLLVALLGALLARRRR